MIKSVFVLSFLLATYLIKLPDLVGGQLTVFNPSEIKPALVFRLVWSGLQDTVVTLHEETTEKEIIATPVNIETPVLDSAGHLDREAALATLEQTGLGGLNPGNEMQGYFETPTADSSDREALVSPSLLPKETTILSSTSLTTAVPEGHGSIIEPVSEEVPSISRAYSDASQDAVFLLILSSGVLVGLYISMRRNLKTRDFSKYR